LQIKTDLLTAKLIETPLLSIINHMTMVSSKAAQICIQAQNRPVFEFGSRRTHIEAAVDAAYAAYLAGCAGTSNLEAHHRYGVPVVGTMDHFAIQAWEVPEKSKADTEYAFFKAFYNAYPNHASLLVDTYDTFGTETGIRNAVKSTQGQLSGIRIDSQITADNMHKARQLLDELGAPEAKIIVSGGMDEHSIARLHSSPVDAFGVGERLVTSADAPVGVGAVGKLSRLGDRFTMKQAKGSAKATLPGPLQVYRSQDGDRVSLLHSSQALPGEIALIHQVWHEETGPVQLPTLEQSRQDVATQLQSRLYIDHKEVDYPMYRIHAQKVHVDSQVIQAIKDCLS
jgi:nicotinate phosphoribosyltransferase